MTRDEAMRRISALHQRWSLKYGDQVPYESADRPPYSGEIKDYPVWQADRSAPPEIDDPLNEKIIAILAQIDE